MDDGHDELSIDDWTFLEVLRDVLAPVACPTFAKDPGGRYLLINRAYRSLLAIPPKDDALGADDGDLHDASLAESLQSFDASVARQHETRSRTFQRPSTPEHPGSDLERRTAPVLDSNDAPMGVIGTMAPLDDSTDATSSQDWGRHDLAKRVRELTCLYEVSTLMKDCADVSADTLDAVAERLSAGWHFPDLACARIRVGDRAGHSSNYVATPTVQRRRFQVNGITGLVEVGYTSKPDTKDHELFIEEEGQLLQSVASRLRDACLRVDSQQQDRLHTTLLDTVGEAVIATDVDGHVIYWNHAAEEMYGWSAEDSLGRNILDLTPAESSFDEALEVMDALSRGSDLSEEFLVKDKEGRQFIAHVSDAPFYDENGHLVGYVGVSRDITTTKELEAELSQAKKLEAIGRLAGGIAHDFNNMLTAIQGNAMLLAADIEDEAHRKTVDEIQHAAVRAEELTSQLLAFSRRQVRNLRVLDLGSVVRDMQNMLERLLDEDIELEFSIAEDAGSVRADASQLNQVLINLAVNARDAASVRDRIEVRVDNRNVGEDTGPARVPAGEYVVLEVSDTGEGMSEDTLENIFEPFFTTKSEEHGTGLGLATVFGIVKQSHGFIDVESEKGVGTTFRVFLPRVFDEPDVFDAPDVLDHDDDLLAASDPMSATILICEDQESVRLVIERALTRTGYVVVTASDGNEALNLARSGDHDFDLIISDIVMPAMSGWELEAQVREFLPDIPFLFVSGYADPAANKRAEPPSPEHYLEKPFKPCELLARVANLLS